MRHPLLDGRPIVCSPQFKVARLVAECGNFDMVVGSRTGEQSPKPAGTHIVLEPDA